MKRGRLALRQPPTCCSEGSLESTLPLHRRQVNVVARGRCVWLRQVVVAAGQRLEREQRRGEHALARIDAGDLVCTVAACAGRRDLHRQGELRRVVADDLQLIAAGHRRGHTQLIHLCAAQVAVPRGARQRQRVRRPEIEAGARSSP